MAAGSGSPPHAGPPGYGRQTERTRRSRLVGRYLVPRVRVRAALLSARETGSLQVLVLLLLPIPVLLLLLMHRASRGRARQDFWALATLFGLLMFFAVGVDMLHEAVEEITDNRVVDLAVTFIESGGEIAAMTALLAYVVHSSSGRSTGADIMTRGRSCSAPGGLTVPRSTSPQGGAR